MFGFSRFQSLNHVLSSWSVQCQPTLTVELKTHNAYYCSKQYRVSKRVSFSLNDPGGFIVTGGALILNQRMKKQTGYGLELKQRKPRFVFSQRN